MSGAEAIGVISGIIALIETTIKLYNAVKDVSGLSPAFRDVAARLPLVQQIAMKLQNGLAQHNQTQAARHAAQVALDDCWSKLVELKAIFKSVVVCGRTSRMQRCLKAFFTILKADKMQGLMDGVVANLQLLTDNHVVQTLTKRDIQDLLEKERGPVTVTRVNSCLSPSMSFSSTGPGSQFIHSQDGNQNMNFGSGPQMNGMFRGTLYFSATH